MVTRQPDGSFALEAALPEITAAGRDLIEAADASEQRAAMDVSRSQQVTYLSGRYYSSQDPTAFASTLALVADTLYLCPLQIEDTVTWDEIYLRVDTGGAGNCRLGIYTGGVSNGELTLAVNAGVVSVSTNGTKSITGLAFTATKGQLLWLAVLPNVACSATSCAAGSLRNRAFRFTSTVNSGLACCVSVSASYAAGLPLSNSAAWTLIAASCPTIGLRKA